MQANQRGDTLTLAATIQVAINSILRDTHTSMPGIIVSYDRAKQLAQVQPALKRKLVNGEELSYPVIQNVPVLFQGNETIKTHFDLKKGDSVLMIFSERSIDKWQDSGNEIVPGDKRKHHISDAICIPGLRPNTKAFEPKGSEGSFVIENDGSFFEIKNDGKFLIKNSENELMSVLVELVDEIVTTLTNDAAGNNLTSTGPQPKDPGYVALINGSKSKIEAIKAKLESFKG